MSAGYVTPRRAAEIRAEIETEHGGTMPRVPIVYPPPAETPRRRPSAPRRAIESPRAEREGHLALFDVQGVAQD